MPQIGANRYIKSCKKARECAKCLKQIAVGQPAIRLFGCAFSGEDVGQLFYHLGCYDEPETTKAS